MEISQDLGKCCVLRGSAGQSSGFEESGWSYLGLGESCELFGLFLKLSLVEEESLQRFGSLEDMKCWKNSPGTDYNQLENQQQIKEMELYNKSFNLLFSVLANLPVL